MQIKQEQVLKIATPKKLLNDQANEGQIKRIANKILGGFE
jgi:hypothetical protein